MSVGVSRIARETVISQNSLLTSPVYFLDDIKSYHQLNVTFVHKNDRITA